MIFLIRHAQAKGNDRRVFLGHNDPLLSPAGHEQAAALRQRFAGVASVWASDLRRAIQTARALAPEVRIDARLREVDFGLWTGRTWEEIERRWPAELRAWRADPEHVAPPGGETLSQLRRRALAAVAALAPGSLVVTHGGVIRALLPGRHAAHTEVCEFEP